MAFAPSDAGVPARMLSPPDLSTPQEINRGRLLSLPAELRLLCYTYAFSYPTSSPVSPSRQLSLLLTCRQVYNEANTLAYSQTDFEIPLHLLSELPSRLRRLRDDQVRCIRHLTVAIDSRSWLEHQPESYAGFLPRFNPHGFPRLSLDVLRIEIRHNGYPGSQIFLNFLVHWRNQYHSTRRAWMDTQSVRKSPTVLFNELMVQWLTAINANKVLLVNADEVDNEYFKVIYHAEKSDSVWRRELKGVGGTILEISKVEPIAFDRAN